MGKFETTGTAAVPTVLPNLESLRNQNISAQFTTAQVFNTYLNNSSLDAHMSKNSEWAAAAYLSQSKYGKYGNSNYSGVEKQVRINNCSNYITGVGADAQNASSSSNTCTTNTYETVKGQTSSTTGNITGIYDMSGGAYEYVMGVYNKTTSSSGFSTLPDVKYYDNYISTSTTTACNGEICYGHALGEISEWYSDYADFVNSSTPWFIRGGGCSGASVSGVFNFDGNLGNAIGTYSFRITLSQAVN